MKKIISFTSLFLFLLTASLCFSQEYQWAKNIGSTDYNYGNGIAIDGSGNVYVTGYFFGTTDFDPGPGTANLVSTGDADIFMAKYDNSGNYIWAKKIGGFTIERGLSIAVDGSGNVYITGYFSSTTDFDPGPGTASLAPAGTDDIFIAKYSTDGNYIWAKKMGGAQYDHGNNIVVDAAGNVYLTGYFQATADFDPGTGTANLTAVGSYDAFFAKYDPNGNYLWAKGIGSSSYEYGNGIAVDGSGNVYITGSFQGACDFDPGAGTVTLTPVGGADIYFAKYNSSGNYLWAKNIGSTASDFGYGITVSSTSNVYITGMFAATADFDPGTGTANLTSAGQGDIFFAKYDQSGNYQWAKKIGGTDYDYGKSIALDNQNNVYITGYFRLTADFNPNAGTANLTSNGVEDIFLAKYNDNGNYYWAKNIGSTDIDYSFSIDLDNAGNVFITGTFRTTVDFDPGTGTANLTSVSSQDIFLAKYKQTLVSNQPQNITVCETSSAHLSVATNGTAPISYQWQYNNGSWNNVANGTPGGATYSNQNTAVLTVNGITAVGNYNYRCYLSNTFGSDTSLAATVTVTHIYSKNMVKSICNGSSFVYNGHNYTTAGIYQDTVFSGTSCDTAYTLNLTVNPVYLLPSTHAICNGETYSWRGHSCTTSGIYYDSLQTISGCDSVFKLTLTVNPTYTMTSNASICNGATYSWRGDNYTVSGTYYDSLHTTKGCDSTFVLQLIVYPVYAYSNNIAICSGETYHWHGDDYSVTGTYYDSLHTMHTCDSVYVLHLTANPVYNFPDNITMCQGEIHHWHGSDYAVSGTYYDSLQTIHGCDSICRLILTVNPTYVLPENTNLCSGETYNWHGNNYTVSGIYYDSLQTIHGCDSVYVLNITFNPTYTFPDIVNICNSDTFNWRGNDYSVTGIYYDSLQTIHGCDSVYVLNLAVNPTYVIPDNISICNSGFYYWHGSNYFVSGTYYDSLQTFHGCDSVHVLNLTFNPVYNFADSMTLCNGESYNWHGNDYSSAGTYYDSLSTVNSCDSIFVLNLAVIAIDTSLIVSDPTITANATGATYQWADCDNGYSPIAGEQNQAFTALVNGNFAVIVTQSGCTDTSTCVPITSIGILESTFSSNIILFPNPSDSWIYIDMGSIYKKIEFEISDIQGRKIIHNCIIDGQYWSFKFDQPTGIYIVSVTSGNERAVIKLIKK